MNVILTGSNGFISSNFLELYRESFSKFTVLIRNESHRLKKYPNVTQVIWDLTDEINIDVAPNTVFIHTAYDSSNLKKNLEGIKNITKFLVKKNIRKLVYISSFSVYDPFYKGNLTEEAPYSCLKDPYSEIKIKVEKFLETQSLVTLKNVSIIALQPSIVYGLYGNWSLHAIKTVYANKIEIPEEGVCPIVFVNDVAKAIYLACNQSVKRGCHKILISSNESTTWKTFYNFHSKLMIPPPEPIINYLKPTANKFHDNNLKEVIYRAFFSDIGVRTLSILMPLLRKIKPLSKTDKANIKEIVKQGKSLEVYRPNGMNRIVHNTKFDIDISKSKSILCFFPEYTLESAYKLIKTKLTSNG